MTKKTKLYKLPKNRIKGIFENFKNSKLTTKKSKKLNLKKKNLWKLNDQENKTLHGA